MNVFCKMWESRICNPTNNITGNTTYISTNISTYIPVSISTYISTNIPVSIPIYISTHISVSIHLQEGFLLRGGEKNHVFCVSLQSRRKGGRRLWAMRQVAFPSCAGMEKRIGMLNIQNKVK